MVAIISPFEAPQGRTRHTRIAPVDHSMKLTTSTDRYGQNEGPRNTGVTQTTQAVVFAWLKEDL
jgi:hypothetical protein